MDRTFDDIFDSMKLALQQFLEAYRAMEEDENDPAESEETEVVHLLVADGFPTMEANVDASTLTQHQPQPTPISANSQLIEPLEQFKSEDPEFKTCPPKSQICLISFDGSNPYAWLFQAEEYFNVYSLFGPAQRLAISTFFMQGDASSWFQWRQRNHPFKDWESFRCSLELCFQPSNFVKVLTTPRLIEPKEFKLDCPKLNADWEVDQYCKIEEIVQKSNGGLASNGFEKLGERFHTLKQEVTLVLHLEVFIGFRPGGLLISKEFAANNCVLKVFDQIPEPA